MRVATEVFEYRFQAAQRLLGIAPPVMHGEPLLEPSPVGRSGQQSRSALCQASSPSTNLPRKTRDRACTGNRKPFFGAIPLYASFHGFWFIWESLGSDG